jgi:hypothetical protein
MNGMNGMNGINNYFFELPIELINILVSYVTAQDEQQFNQFYELSVEYPKYNSNQNWEKIFSDYIPDYSNIKYLMSIDYQLKEYRYKNWRVLYYDCKLLLRAFDTLPEISDSFIYNKDVYFLGIAPETMQIVYSLKLYQEFPSFYFSVSELPNTLITKKMFYKELIDFKSKYHVDSFLKSAKISDLTHISNYTYTPSLLVLLINQSYEQNKNDINYINYVYMMILSIVNWISATIIDYSTKSYMLLCIKSVLLYFDNEVLLEFAKSHRYLSEIIISIKPELLPSAPRNMRRTLLFNI